MRSVVGKVKEEWIVSVLFNEGQCSRREDVGDVASRFNALLAFEELVRVVVIVDEPVLPEAEELIEAAILRMVPHVTAEMPFPDTSCLVPTCPKQRRERDFRLVQRIAAFVGIYRAGALVMPSGHN